jgi:hypothetical protein
VRDFRDLGSADSQTPRTFIEPLIEHVAIRCDAERRVEQPRKLAGTQPRRLSLRR